jgi:hypothetical protein
VTALFLVAFAALAGFGFYMDHLSSRVRHSGEDADAAMRAWASQHTSQWRPDEYVAVRDDVAVVVSIVEVDSVNDTWMIAVRATTRTGHDPPRVHRGAWRLHRLPLPVDASDEARACCVRTAVTARHAIVSDGATVLAWVDPPVTPAHLEAIVDEVATIARERPLLDDPERIDPSRGGPFR